MNPSASTSSSGGSTPGSMLESEEALLDFKQQYGIKFIRGAEVFEMKDEQGVSLNDTMKCVGSVICSVYNVVMEYMHCMVCAFTISW